MSDLASRYTNWRPIGSGGSSTVYRVLDCELGDDVAIKLLKPDIMRSTDIRAALLKGLRSEVKISRMLRHPSICPIHDLYDGPEGVGVVMDFVAGGELRRWMTDTSERLTETAGGRLEVLRKLAEALCIAHAHIVHRDLKPGNIILRDGDIGRPVIMDFGYSVVGEVAGLEAAWAFTPKYMAPEQFESPNLVDRRADLFALGVMAYELFTNRIPPTSLRHVLQTRTVPRVSLDEIDPPSLYCPRVPPALDRLIVHQLMAYSPANRLGSAEEVLSVLDRIELLDPTTFTDAPRRERVNIEGGDYFLGARAATSRYASEWPGKRVRLGRYVIDAVPVTNREYRRFIAHTGHVRPPLIDDPVFGRDDHPVVAVNFYDAQAFARWVGGCLVSETQWECAARGGLAFAEYPWGSAQPDAGRANIDGAGRCTSPVHAFPAGRNPYGIWDMCGNVWEWCADVYDEDFYRRIPVGEVDPLNSGGDGPRVVRGGSFQSFAVQGRCAFRGSARPDEQRNDIGFRVAYPAQPPVPAASP
jgi:formylglycine-generating enzyme required for sulfatase activity/tRNA A-37 threonylcarbamoyl transferase component Bud32